MEVNGPAHLITAVIAVWCWEAERCSDSDQRCSCSRHTPPAVGEERFLCSAVLVVITTTFPLWPAVEMRLRDISHEKRDLSLSILSTAGSQAGSSLHTCAVSSSFQTHLWSFPTSLGDSLPSSPHGGEGLPVSHWSLFA